MHGSEAITKDVLEYVVFEKHLSNEYGVWRLHGKIIPEWTPAKDPQLPTTVIEDEPSDQPEASPAQLSDKPSGKASGQEQTQQLAPI